MRAAQRTGLWSILMGLLITVTLVTSLKYLRSVNDIEYKQWDIATCTPADYTVKMKISQKMYDNYKAQHSHTPLDELIINELENKVKTLKSVNKADDGSEYEIKVAIMKFGYRNGELIRKLKKRGLLIGQGKFAKVEEADDQLNALIQEDYDKIQTPCCAFITYTHQEANERTENQLFTKTRSGDKNEDKVDFELLGE